ncbi:MAG: hypothetical protein WB493_04980 [Anaeromyxobacteraceae bacterium]
MRGKREQLYECTYGLAGGEARVVFRAWTPAEAAQDTEEALSRAGIPHDGDITVRDMRGRLLLRVTPPARPSTGLSGAA